MPTDIEIMRSSAGFIASALSAATGETWTVDTSWDSSFMSKLNGPDGQALAMRYGPRSHDPNQKLIISGIYPPKVNGEYLSHVNHKIGVARTRPVEQIATEILRRLLPKYVPELAAYRARILVRETAETARLALANELTRATGGSLRHNKEVIDFTAVGGAHATIRVYSGHSATFEIQSAPAELLRALVAASTAHVGRVTGIEASPDQENGSAMTKLYDHTARPDDLPEPGDRCKDCGKDITWEGPSQYDWIHVDEQD